MANMIIGLKGDNGQLPPAAVELIRQGAFYVPPQLRHAYCGTPDGLLSIPDVSTDAAGWHGLPIAANLPADNFEVLVRTVRLTPGTTNWNNGGGGIALTQNYLAEDIDSIIQTPLYYFNYGSQNSASIYVCYLRNTPDPQVIVGNVNAVAGSYTLNEPLISYMRIRRNGATIQGKSWFEGASEPAAWQLNASNSARSVSHVFLLTLMQTAILYTDMAIATNGDTATLDVPSITITGTTNHTGRAYPVQVLDYETHMHLGAGWTDPLTGEWSVEVFSDGDVYARVDGPNGPEYDYQFAAGHGFLAGSHPDGITSVEGVPASAEIRVHLRASGETADGALIAHTTSNPDGTWMITGLDHTRKYDVICRHEGYNDMILSNVSPALEAGPE